MPSRGAASRHLLVCVVITVAVATTDGIRVPPGNQELTSKDGCRIMPADDCVGVNVDCSNLHLGHIPDDLPTHTRKLIMRHNNITELSDYSLEKYTELTSLDLSRNDLRALGVHAFSGMSRLLQLDLAYNNLCLNNDTYPVGIFRGMTSLRRLAMTSNVCGTEHAEYPAESLAPLSNLEFLSLTGIPTVQLGDGFGRLTKLKTLLFAGHGCNLPELRDTMFHSLRDVNLTHLCIKACHLKTMEGGTLAPLSHLKTLNLACNEFVGFSAIHKAIAAAKAMRLETLVVDDVAPSGWILDREHFAHIALSSIVRLSARANDIVELDVRLLRLLKRLHHVNGGYNSVTAMLPKINRTAVAIDVLFSLNLDVIDISDFFSDRHTFRERYCFQEAESSTEDPTDPTDYFFREPPPYDDLDYSRPPPPVKTCHGGRTHEGQKHCHTVPPSVQVTYADNIVYKNETRHIEVAINVSSDNDVVVLNVSHNTQFNSIGPIHGLRRCQVIDISHCAIGTLIPGALSDLPMLKYLYLSDNIIGESEADLQGMFVGLSSLEVLDLSRNGISNIHVNAFSSLTNLRTLLLNGNHLTSVNFDINGLHRLTAIYLARNKINHFAVKSSATASSSNSCVYVDLYWNPVNVRNPFRCRKPVVARQTARCITSTTTQHPVPVTGDITAQHPPSDSDNKSSDMHDKSRLNKTLVISLVVVAALTVVVVVVVVVVVTNNRRCTRLRDRLRTIVRVNGYQPVDNDHPISLIEGASNSG